MITRLHPLFRTVCALAVLLPAQALVAPPFFSQQAELTGTAVATAKLGSSVAISADGNTAVAGGPTDTSQTGAIWIFVRNGANWTQQGGKLVGNDASGTANQGTSVAISADGNTVIEGGSGDNRGVGAAWIFTRTGTTWTQQGAKLVGTGSTNVPRLGSSVALSADGNTALVGGMQDNVGTGAVWVFTRSAGVWTQQAGPIVGTGATGPAHQGAAAALSADGNTALVGGYSDNSNVGAVWVFTRSGGVWTQQAGPIVGTGATGIAQQGAAVALSADGNTALVGGNSDNNDAGAVWVFTRSAGNWTQQGDKLVGTGAIGAAAQGNSVGLSADGNTAVEGGPFDNTFAGAIWVFTRSAGNWTQQGPKLVGTGAEGAANQGASVALSGDGNTALSGGPTDTANAGAVWVFTGTANTASAGNPQSTPVNTAFSFPLEVTVTDASGNYVSGAVVTFTAPGSGPSAVLSSPAPTDIHGRTHVTATANGIAGSYVVTATTTAPASTATFVLSNVNTAAATGPCTVSSGADDNTSGTLRYQVAACGVGGTITFSGVSTVVLDQHQDIQLTQNLTIDGSTGGMLHPATRLLLGGAVIIDANGDSRIFFQTAGTVTLKNLTLQNGLAKGGDGGLGAGGAAGMGGAVFVNNGTLAIGAVTFANNQAIGGNGGPDNGLEEGGGGGVGANGGPGMSQPGNGGGGGDFGTSGSSNGDGAGLDYAVGTTAGFGGGAWATAAGGFGAGGGAAGGSGGAFGGTGAGAGGAGAGLGGAIFVRAGLLVLNSATFASNSATKGQTVSGLGAQGKGGALFIYSTAGAVSIGTPTFTNDIASDAGTGTPCSAVLGASASDTNDICGTLEIASIAATSGDGQSTAAGSQFANMLIATVTSDGITVPGVPVDFAGPTSGASTNPPVTSATTASNGHAAVTETANGTTGGYTVTALVGGVPTSATFSLTNTVPILTASIAQAFGSASIPLNASTSLTFTITNPNSSAGLTAISFSDTMPSGLIVANPSGLQNTCGGTATAVVGSGSVTLSGGTLAASGTCTVSLNVTVTTAGAHPNSAAISSNQGSGNTAMASLLGVSPAQFSKSFSPASVAVGGTSTLTFNISNPNTPSSLFDLAFTDMLPAGLQVASPNNLTNNCNGNATAAPGSNTITLMNGVLGNNTGGAGATAACSVTVSVKGTTAGTYINVTSPVSSSTGGDGPTASASITVVGPPVLAKFFGASMISVGSSTSLTFTLTNPNAATALTGVGFSDTLPQGVRLASPTGLTGSCGGGSINATVGSQSISLSGATLPANASCTISVNVTGTDPGDYTNTTAPTSTNGGTGPTASVSIQVGGATMLAAISAIPNSGTGTGPVTFSALYTDALRAADLQVVYLDFGSSLFAAHSCIVGYIQASNKVFLFDDNNSANVLELTLGSGGSISNSQCTLLGGNTPVTVSGNNLTVPFSLTFLPAFAGTQNIFGIAQSYSGTMSSPQLLGAWATEAGGPFGAISVTPNNGSGLGPQAFNAVYTDPGGAADLQVVYLDFGTSPFAPHSCIVAYAQTGNGVYLFKDDNSGAMGPILAGSASTLSNSQCTVTAGLAMASGNNLTVPFTVTFAPSFTGSQTIYGLAQKYSGVTGGTMVLGTYTPAPAGPLAAVSVTPNSGTGMTQRFNAVYTDPSGAMDLQVVYLDLGTSLFAANSCIVGYNPTTNQVFLFADDNSSVQMLTLGSGAANTVSNTQCTLSAGTTLATAIGNNLTVPFSISFKAPTTDQIWGMAQNDSGTQSSWLDLGTWNTGP